jgi:hypothetical protein
MHMADIFYRDLLWQVRSELPGVPQPLVLYHYAETVRDFCTRTKAWNYSIEGGLDLDADTAWPTITPGTHIPDATYIVEPTRAKWSDGCEITFKTRDQLDRIDGDWEQAVGSSPQYWTVTGPKAWRIYPLLTEDTVGQLYIRAALAPTFVTSEAQTSRGGMPEELVNEFQDIWSYGTMARLMKIPGKDWSNDGHASAYSVQYENGIKTAKSRAAADFGRPHRTVQYGGYSIGGSGHRISDYGR